MSWGPLWLSFQVAAIATLLTLVFGIAFALLLTGAAVLALADTSKGGSVSYRWVDENGVVHYGDRVPPQYSQKETSVINSQGVEVERREALKSGGRGGGELDGGFVPDHGQQYDLVEVSVGLKPNLHEGRLAAASLA